MDGGVLDPPSRPEEAERTMADVTPPRPSGARLRHLGEYVLYLAVQTAVRALPHRAARPLGRRLGRLGFRVDRRHRRITEENLQSAFPEWDPARVEQTARACFEHWGAMLCETVSLVRFSPEEVVRQVDLQGWEHLESALAEGRGALLISAHLGNWEMGAHPIAMRLGGLPVVGRPLNNPYLDRKLKRERERFGLRFIAKRGAAHRVATIVRRKGVVGLVMDQHVRPSQGIPVPFFGRPAWTSPVPAMVALHARAPAVPVFCHPLEEGGYRAVIEPPIRPGGLVRDEAGVAQLTARYMAVIEAAVRRHPEQWMWLHRRWRDDEVRASAEKDPAITRV